MSRSLAPILAALLLLAPRPLAAQEGEVTPPAGPVESPASSVEPEPEAEVVAEETPEPDPADIDYWMGHDEIEGELWAGFAWQDNQGLTNWTRETGTEPSGLVFRRGDLRAYLGDGVVLELNATQPFETDQSGGFLLRQFGLGDLRGQWTTVDYASFPETSNSRWLSSDLRARYTGAEEVGITVERRHRAHAGPREIGPINGETIETTLQVPFDTAGGRVRGRAMYAQRDYQDHGGRWTDTGTTRANGTVQVRLGEDQYLLGGLAMHRADAEGIVGSTEVTHYTLGYTDLALGNAERLRWEVRGDLEQTDSSVTRNWFADRDWSLGTYLTYTDAEWRASGGITSSSMSRYRLDARAFTELLIDPAREGFDRGIYLKDSPEKTTYDFKVQWRPEPAWLVKGGWRHATLSGLPDTNISGEGEGILVTPLWFSTEDRRELSARYALGPGEQILITGLWNGRELSARDSSTSYRRLDATYQNATEAFSWWVRVGEYGYDASLDAVDAFSNRAFLYGAGFSTPFLDDRLTVSADATLANGTGSDSYDEWAGSLSATWEVDEDRSLVGTYTLQAIDLTEPNDYVEAESHRVGVWIYWKW